MRGLCYLDAKIDRNIHGRYSDDLNDELPLTSHSPDESPYLSFFSFHILRSLCRYWVFCAVGMTMRVITP